MVKTISGIYGDANTGKTGYLLNMVKQYVLKGMPFIIISLEYNTGTLLQKLISQCGKMVLNDYADKNKVIIVTLSPFSPDKTVIYKIEKTLINNPQTNTVFIDCASLILFNNKEATPAEVYTLMYDIMHKYDCNVVYTY